MKRNIGSALLVMVAALAGCDYDLSSLLTQTAAAATALTAETPPMDSDRDGTVSKDEWTAFHAEMFAGIDADGDARLSADELRKGGGRGGPEMKPPVEDMDADGDGAVSKEEWTSFHDALFAGIDEDGDGYLSAAELAAHRRDRNPAGGPPFALMDTDGNRSISRVEWTSFHTALFNRIDTDSDQFLSAAELKAMRPGGPPPEEGREGMDSDGDGSISEQEWSDFHATLFTAMDVNGDDELSPDELPQRE